MSMSIEKEEVGNVYGCFRCGELCGEVVITTESTLPICGSCGESSVLTFQQALDVMNELHLSGELMLSSVDTEAWAEELQDIIEEV